MGPIPTDPNQINPQITLDRVRRHQENIGKELHSNRKQTILWLLLLLVVVIAIVFIAVYH